MTSYNRPECLQMCLASLAKSVFLEPTRLIITDDHSNDDQVKTILEDFQQKQINNLKVDARFRTENLGCDLSVIESINHGFEQTDDDYLIVQDSDAIFNPLWLFAINNTIELFKPYGYFAASMWNNRKAIRSIGEVGQYDIRFGLNGFNLLIYRNVFQQLVHGNHNWDHEYCQICRDNGYPMVSSKMSFVKHMGLTGYHQKWAEEDTVNFIGE